MEARGFRSFSSLIILICCSTLLDDSGINIQYKTNLLKVSGVDCAEAAHFVNFYMHARNGQNITLRVFKKA
jgi:hypothetical protein